MKLGNPEEVKKHTDWVNSHVIVEKDSVNHDIPSCFQLGTIWEIEKFHYFLYGKEFTLETDQKPLVSIYKKHMIDISPRVQRLIVRSFPYLPFKVVYKKGIDIPVAEVLSHVTPMDLEDNIKLPIKAVNMITTRIPMSVESQGSFSSKLE